MFKFASQTNSQPSATLLSKAAIVAVLAFTGVAVDAQAMSNTSDNPTSGQLARARQICESVVRVRPGEEHFAGCVSSLTDSLQSAGRIRAAVRARNACFARGLKADGTELGLCLLQANDAIPAAEAASPPGMANATEIEMKQDTDVSTSFDAVFHREQLACAQLGLDPAFGTFDSCVASLQGTLQSVDFSGG